MLLTSTILVIQYSIFEFNGKNPALLYSLAQRPYRKQNKAQGNVIITIALKICISQVDTNPVFPKDQRFNPSGNIGLASTQGKCHLLALLFLQHFPMLSFVFGKDLFVENRLSNETVVYWLELENGVFDSLMQICT